MSKMNSLVSSKLPPYVDEITLLGSSDVEYRINLLSTLLDQAEDKVNHIDDSRQRNLNYALAIFAGLIGLGIGLDDFAYRLYISITLFIVMGIFCLWDRRLHKISHGWQSTASTFCRGIGEVINKPGQDTTFPRYRTDAEKRAEWFSFQPMIFYALVLGGLATFLMFLLLSI
jgi:hypothetical protein